MSKFKSLSENKQAIIISIIYAICCKFFKCVYLQVIPKYEALFALLSMSVMVFMFGYVVRQYKNKDYSHYVSILTLLFYFSLIVGFFFHGQIGYYPLKSLCMYTGPMMILIFFLLKRWDIGLRVLIKAIVFSCILYCIAYVIGTLTFPNQIFGFDDTECKQDLIEGSSESRGILRLFIYGSQIIPLTIFIILTYFNEKKKYYILLLPLFIMLMMQGARTPFFICIFICVAYFLYNMKQKFLLLIIGICIYVGGFWLYERILNSSSDDAFTIYVQMTHNQVEQNKDEDDIRIEMSKYMLFDFNDMNLLQICLGNGFPDGVSSYSKKLSKLSKFYNYYTDDVGIVQIFVYMGLLGLIIYFYVFYNGIKVKVPNKYSFGRLFLLHYALISFANNAMVMYGMFTFGLALYSIYRANIEMKTIE